MNDIFHSATIKLTVWYLTLVMLVSLLFSVVVYVVGHNELSLGLHNQTARIYQTYPVFTSDPFFLRDNDVEMGSHHLLMNLLYLNVIIFVSAGFASYWLARRTLEPIARADDLQKRFVADASHELRTPLTALKMETEVALMDTAASKQALRSALHSNLEEVSKLESLLASLLQLGKLDSNGLEAVFKPVELDAVITRAIERTRLQATAKHIRVDNDATSQQTIHGDDESLVQLFAILLDNAIKYSPEHSAITVDSHRSENYAVATVADQGIGIEPAALEHVFDRFYRADKARTRNNGYGLGLSIAKQIADMHHGSISLSSTAGKGTKATVNFPLVIDQSVEREPGDTGQRPHQSEQQQDR